MVTTADVGARLRKLRIERGLTTGQFGKMIGLSQGQVSRVERGERNISTEAIIRSAKALRIPPFCLLMTGPEQRHCRGSGPSRLTSKDVGATIRTVRQARGLTINGLRKKSGVSSGHISRLERGVQGLRFGVLVKLAEGVT